MKVKPIVGRKFLAEPPYLSAVSWETCMREEPKFCQPLHFYGKFTLQWDSKKVGIHSYAEHGAVGATAFVEKCNLFLEAANNYMDHCATKTFCRETFILNEDNSTPYSGSVFYMRGESPSGLPISLFELASCKEKIRIHAADVGGERKLCTILRRICAEVRKLQAAAEIMDQQIKLALRGYK